jgi:drug/metabolite transporter (DMT)-like permease
VRIAGLLLVAAIAAIGNAVFAIGQRQSAGIANRLTIVTLGAGLAVLLAMLTAPLLGTPDYGPALRRSWPAVALSGVGLFLTYLGFNLMYARYGASSYVVYAVLSVLTTSVGVGGFYFGERFTAYHYAAMLSAVVTLVLYSLGESTN